MVSPLFMYDWYHGTSCASHLLMLSCSCIWATTSVWMSSSVMPAITGGGRSPVELAHAQTNCGQMRQLAPLIMYISTPKTASWKAIFISTDCITAILCARTHARLDGRRDAPAEQSQSHWPLPCTMMPAECSRRRKRKPRGTLDVLLKSKTHDRTDYSYYI